VGKPAVGEQQSAWAKELGSAAPDHPALLAAQFNLNLPNLRRLAQLARRESEGAPESLPEKIWEICRQSERPRLDALAQRLEPKMTWDDLVLPRAEMKLLREISAQVRQRNKVYGDWGFARKMNRGFGISALFAGDSGCGKTMAAEVIANDLRLNLYRIDLSAVVNKYIGETEKNLRRLFDAAEEGGSILFFDEADALFGKRSEVKDSHDRYANIEINYLLQRLESYRGLAILATNMKSALDAAFLRRLRFVVNFPFPAIADRRRLWEKAFLQAEVARKQPGPPLEALDYERLARLNLTGGHIHNVALNACFMAANSPRLKVTMPLVLEAARAEFLKLDRPVNETEFRWTNAGSNASAMANGHAEPAQV
jgi:SpoVK/Ycf46/Vps4 family AAA+-type ATPase